MWSVICHHSSTLIPAFVSLSLAQLLYLPPCVFAMCQIQANFHILQLFQVNSTPPGVIYYAIIRKLCYFLFIKRAIYFQNFQRTSNGWACWFLSCQAGLKSCCVHLWLCDLEENDLNIAEPYSFLCARGVVVEALRRRSMQMKYVCKWCYQPMKICHLFDMLVGNPHLSKIWVYFLKHINLFHVYIFT